jgi:hypothetical protein
VPREANGTDTARIYIRTSTEIAAYIDELVRLGIHGKTPSEVAKTLIGHEIERLIRDGFLEIRKAT